MDKEQQTLDVIARVERAIDKYHRRFMQDAQGRAVNLISALADEGISLVLRQPVAKADEQRTIAVRVTEETREVAGASQHGGAESRRVVG